MDVLVCDHKAILGKTYLSETLLAITHTPHTYECMYDAQCMNTFTMQSPFT